MMGIKNNAISDCLSGGNLYITGQSFRIYLDFDRRHYDMRTSRTKYSYLN